MSSKRQRRKKRKIDLQQNNPNIVNTEAVEAKKENNLKVEKLPGQTLVKTGSIFLLISALLSALIVWYAVRALRSMNADELIAYTKAAHQTPMSYTVTLVMTSIAAVFQMIFGYSIFRNSNNPFYWKTALIMSVVLAGIELSINIVSLILSEDAFNIVMLLYGVAFPVVIIIGALKYKKFADNHPDYPVPEPIKMF